MHTRSVSLTKVSLPLVAVALLALPSLVWSQQSLRAGAKGATAEAPVTSSPIDADHQALDVYVRGGGGGGAGGGGVITDVQDGAGDSTMDAVNNAQRVTAVTAIQTTNIVPSSGLTLQKAGFNITTATTTTIISDTNGQTVNVYGLWFYPGDMACDITLQDSGGTNLITAGATIDVLANQGANFQTTLGVFFRGAATSRGNSGYQCNEWSCMESVPYSCTHARLGCWWGCRGHIAGAKGRHGPDWQVCHVQFCLE